jgi:ligand-binding sensor domain-containing protein
MALIPAGWLGAVLLLVAAPALAQAPRPAIENFQVGPDVYVRALAVDRRSNSLWVGTSGGALEIDLATSNAKRTFTRKDGLANEYVFAIGVDPGSEAIWFGTNAGGTSRYAGGQWKTFFPMHGLADYWVYAYAFDREHRVWMGTWDGASLYDPKTDSFATYRKELINIWVYGIDIDKDGRVWFGTEGGVSMLENSQWRSWKHEDGLGGPNVGNLPASLNTGLGTRARHDLSTQVKGDESYNPNYVFAVKVDRRDNAVWFGTWGGGASRFDGRSWTSLGRKDGLAGDIVYAIEQAEDGTLWFGTNRGVSRWDGKSWASYSTPDGLIGENVYAIAAAPDGAVWVGMKGGASRLVFRR